MKATWEVAWATLSSELIWLFIEVNSETSKAKEVDAATPEVGETVLVKQRPATKAPAEQVAHS